MTTLLYILLTVLYFCMGIFLPAEPENFPTRTSLKRDFLHRIFEERADRLDPQKREQVIEYLIEAQRVHGIDALLLTAIMEEESRFDPNGLSKKGARGLMQIIPLTGRDIAEEIDISWQGSEDLYDPEINIKIGTAYLAELKEEFVDWELVLAIYNMGYRKFKEYQVSEVEPPWIYSYRVLREYRKLKREYKAFRKSAIQP